jgi:fumarylacetoacetate (FAA) hydrolase
MRFATYSDGTADGKLMVVSKDLNYAAPASHIAKSLRDAMERWESVTASLQALSREVDAGTAVKIEPFDAAKCEAPMPRSPQWLDGSAFRNHGALMEQAFKIEPPPDFNTVPLMYQGASDDFLGPCTDVPLPRVEDGIDFEGEFGVVVGNVPMGVSAAAAVDYIRLVVLINDWSLRALGPREMKGGFGFVQAKPSTAFAPVAVTLDELNGAWRDARVYMRLRVDYNGERFGTPHGGEMTFDFGKLIAHAASSRRLTAGTIIGSGTISNASRDAGSACIAERRVIEMIDNGGAVTGFMQFGDSVRMQAFFDDGRTGPFGVIEQRVVPSSR